MLQDALSRLMARLEADIHVVTGVSPRLSLYRGLYWGQRAVYLVSPTLKAAPALSHTARAIRVNER